MHARMDVRPESNASAYRQPGDEPPQDRPPNQFPCCSGTVTRCDKAAELGSRDENRL